MIFLNFIVLQPLIYDKSCNEKKCSLLKNFIRALSYTVLITLKHGFSMHHAEKELFSGFRRIALISL